MNKADVESIYPLSPLQQGLLFHSLSEPDSGMYFNQTAMPLSGKLNAGAFCSAWQQAVDRHPILRTFFVWEGVPSPVQVVRKQAQMPLEFLDWRDQDAAAQEQSLTSLRREDLRRGFVLSQAPLMRASMIQLAEQEYCFFWSFHHILMDGWSMFEVLAQVFKAYDAQCAGDSYTPRESRPYRDHIVWLNQQSVPAAKSFWSKNLSGFSAPTPLLDDPATARIEHGQDGFAAEIVHLDEDTSSALQSFASTHHITLNTLLQGAWALLLSRYSGEDDVLFGAVVSGRPPTLEGVESMVGLFINTLPVRVQTPGAEPVLDWLKRVQAEQAELREFEYSPLIDIQGWSDVPRESALFESIFLFENYKKDAPIEELCKGLRIGDVQWFERHNFPLAALAIPGENFMLRLIYQTDRYAQATIQRMLGHWRTLLEGIVADAEQAISSVPMLTARERQQLIIDWNQTRTEYPREACIHHLFEERAEHTPDAPAVLWRDEVVSYSELNTRANRLAWHLKRLGVGPEVIVGLCLNRTPDMIVSLLATLKAGGAYMSLDPSYPAPRLQHMLQDSRASVLLTTRQLSDGLPDREALTVCLDEDVESIAAEREANPPHDLQRAEQLAYVIYTSGSTGLPKGTLIPHRAVVRLVRNTDFAHFGPDEVMLQFATVSFDASTLELWGSLLNGAQLVLFPSLRASIEELGDVIARHEVTTLWLTAGLFHSMIDEAPEQLRGLRQLIAGGDVLSVSHVKQALTELEGCTVINGYGPTENTTFTCCHPMTDPGGLGKTIPIGRPIANTTVYILDEFMQPVPIGVEGDLYTGGDGLAREYLRQPELTQARFVSDPFQPEGSARLYQTGDRARYLDNGTIEFFGRRDSQVKLRGYRIELAEIETVLCREPSVREAIVTAREDTPGDQRLVAYVVGHDLETDALRESLRSQLPDYMVPSYFVAMDSLPLTSNGKVDRSALPAPESSSTESTAHYAPPRGELEESLAAIWQDVLKVDRVGVSDNFFDLGGHSLSLIRVHAAVQKHLGRKIPMVEMFQFPTVSSLAAHLGAADPSQESKRPTGPTAGDLQAGKSRLARLKNRRRR